MKTQQERSARVEKNILKVPKLSFKPTKKAKATGGEGGGPEKGFTKRRDGTACGKEEKMHLRPSRKNGQRNELGKRKGKPEKQHEDIAIAKWLLKLSRKHPERLKEQEGITSQRAPKVLSRRKKRGRPITLTWGWG